MTRKPALGFSLASLQQCCSAWHLCRVHVPGFHPSQDGSVRGAPRTPWQTAEVVKGQNSGRSCSCLASGEARAVTSVSRCPQDCKSDPCMQACSNPARAAPRPAETLIMLSAGVGQPAAGHAPFPSTIRSTAGAKPTGAARALIDMRQETDKALGTSSQLVLIAYHQQCHRKGKAWKGMHEAPAYNVCQHEHSLCWQHGC